MSHPIHQSYPQTQRYRQAAERVLESLKNDKSVLAVILYGSLADGIVWEKSDMNMVVIVRDDKEPDAHYIDADGIVVDLHVYPRTVFTQAIKYMNKPQIGGCGDSVPFPTGGQILYNQDDSLQDFLDDLSIVGKADMEQALLPRTCDMLQSLKKAEKCVRVYNDVTHARYYLLEMAQTLAEMEICLNRKSPSMEPLLQAAAINPALMQRFYEYPMNNALDAENVLTLIKEAYAYLDSHLDVICRQLLRYLSSGEPVGISDITAQFKAHVIHITEYLSEKGLIYKTGVPISITAKGRQVAEEIAYIYAGDM